MLFKQRTGGNLWKYTIQGMSKDELNILKVFGSCLNLCNNIFVSLKENGKYEGQRKSVDVVIRGD